MDLSDVPHTGLDAVVGLRVTAIEADRVVAAFETADHLLDATGTLHKGVLSSVIESAASVAAAAWFADRGHVVGVSNTTSHFAPVARGSLQVVAEPVDRQAARQHWSVRVMDDQGRLVSRGEVQLANIADAGRLGS